MPKKAPELTAIQVKRLTHGITKPPPSEPDNRKRVNKPGTPCNAYHAVGGVAGLLLCVKPTGARSWILRATVGNKRRDMGLGAFPDVTLAQARERARTTRDQIFNGLDPVEERRKAQQALQAEQVTQITFVQAFAEFMTDKKGPGLSTKTVNNWKSTVKKFAEPEIGALIVSRIGAINIEQVLRPIWQTNTMTAKRLRGRLEAFFKWAIAKGYYTNKNPAEWDNNLDSFLPKPSDIHTESHFKALPIDDAPAFIDELRKREAVSARALEFCILTAARTKEVRNACWSEIDLVKGRWEIPANKMKAKEPHTVPLCAAAMIILESMPRQQDLIFTNEHGRKLSENAMLMLIDRMGYKSTTTTHGFRRVFKSWATERADSPDFVSEMALAHKVGNEVRQAYAFSDLFGKRLKLMRDWARFLGYNETGARVIKIGVGA